jgi:8-oxo-dGTP pyrophosphatase MutT (NUDIX family)
VSTRAARRLPVIDSVSAGGIVWRRDPGGAVEVVVGYQAGDRRWALPKGTPDAGETLEETALREVTEETGLEVALGEKVGVIEYWFSQGGRRYHKRVHHWLMTPEGGDFAARDGEFDEVIWAPAGEALAQITFATERSILEQALAALGEGL